MQRMFLLIKNSFAFSCSRLNHLEILNGNSFLDFLNLWNENQNSKIFAINFYRSSDYEILTFFKIINQMNHILSLRATMKIDTSSNEGQEIFDLFSEIFPGTVRVFILFSKYLIENLLSNQN